MGPHEGNEGKINSLLCFKMLGAHGTPWDHPLFLPQQPNLDAFWSRQNNFPESCVLEKIPAPSHTIATHLCLTEMGNRRLAKACRRLKRNLSGKLGS